MTTLTNDEQRVYTNIIANVIPSLSTGKYYAKDFFGTDPVCPRVVKKLYEEVSLGNVPRTKLYGTESKEGYVVA